MATELLGFDLDSPLFQLRQRHPRHLLRKRETADSAENTANAEANPTTTLDDSNITTDAQGADSTGFVQAISDTTSDSPNLSTSNLPTLSTVSIPSAVVTIPSSNDNPFILRSNNPSGMAFIVVGIIMAVFAFIVFVYFLINIYIANRLVKENSKFMAKNDPESSKLLMDSNNNLSHNNLSSNNLNTNNRSSFDYSIINHDNSLNDLSNSNPSIPQRLSVIPDPSNNDHRKSSKSMFISPTADILNQSKYKKSVDYENSLTIPGTISRTASYSNLSSVLNPFNRNTTGGSNATSTYFAQINSLNDSNNFHNNDPSNPNNYQFDSPISPNEQFASRSNSYTNLSYNTLQLPKANSGQNNTGVKQRPPSAYLESLFDEKKLGD
ncbi:uncharacterized protein ASCRUDRAFT_75089 [Ascoidea rubescens DSM 1968]|uniref:Vacuolar membrane protein n=1 Tax=Ascoidea rubescens DSM 1968 TaxID=1344418 RepID=A0A1D2VJL1_9ASCO|nr:hypothetical protein ASCRUDRAFT_75089 [Ascoidea rubescens DSM 1968]ODV61814.1 hypothetical protein ASCRUDRAFT_75089 [Ascoidea rubescens DSM 1968]